MNERTNERMNEGMNAGLQPTLIYLAYIVACGIPQQLDVVPWPSALVADMTHLLVCWCLHVCVWMLQKCLCVLRIRVFCLQFGVGIRGDTSRLSSGLGMHEAPGQKTHFDTNLISLDIYR